MPLSGLSRRLTRRGVEISDQIPVRDSDTLADTASMGRNTDRIVSGFLSIIPTLPSLSEKQTLVCR